MLRAYYTRRSLNVVTGILYILTVTSFFSARVQGQEDPGPVDPNKYDPNRQTGDDNQYNQNDIRNQPQITDQRLKYFMDSSTDCNRGVRTVSEGPIIVNGRGATQQGSPVIDCTLQLELQTPQTASRLKIEITNMDIRDCDVKFTIYDGASTQQKILNSFDCQKRDLSSNQRIVFTSLSSNRVTFVLDRRSAENLAYEIVVEVSVARSDPVNPDSKPIDTDYRTWKFEQRYLVLIVGVCYAILTATLFIVFVVSWYSMPRKTPGALWNQAQFSQASAYSNPALNTTAGSHPSNRGQPLTLGAWVKNGGMNAGMKIKPVHERNPVHVKKRIVMRSEDADSVFESDADIVKKKPLPYTDTDGEERRQIRTHNANKPHAAERAINTSYTLADDDHPQDYYLQREIEAPVKHKKTKRRNQKRDADSNSSSSSENEKLSSDTDSDAETEKTSIGVNNDPEDSDHAVQQHDNTDNEDDDDDENDNEVAMYAKPKKPVKQERQPNAQRPVPAPRNNTPDEPGSRNHTPEPHPRPVNAAYQERSAPPGNYREHHPPPQQYYDPQQTRYVPQSTQHDASYDPIPPPNYNYSRGMPSGHQPANYSMAPPQQPANYGGDQPYRHPPPYAASTPPRQRRGPLPPQDNSYPQQANPKDPPVYSYLVQRGYNPVDMEGYSPASSATSHHSTDNRLDESGYSANLDSGVELMKRHTAV